MNALEIKNFSKKYGEAVAVDNVSFSIEEGEFFGFLGRNGAGKTTTIHCISGITGFTDGSICVYGTDVRKEYRKARTLVGLSPQEYNVDFFQKVYNVLWYMAGYQGIPKKKRKEVIDNLVELFELGPHVDKTFMQLSGGLKRRVMLARAMVHDPKLLILDEPTAGVDVELRHELWEYLRKINKEGKTILFTSHYLEEVEQLCNRIAIIHEGKIIAIDDKSAFVKEGSSLEKKYLEMTKDSSKKHYLV